MPQLQKRYLRLFDASFSSTIVELSHMAERSIEFEPTLFDQWYEQLPSVNFSRDVLQGREALLQVCRASGQLGQNA